MKSFIFIYIIFTTYCIAQPNPYFRKEVEDISIKYDSLWDANKETIVFTGSSSIRMWRNLHEIFPQYQVINSGFGGSTAIDLLGYTDELILKYKPKKVFIYEGDNDISSKMKCKDILDSYNQIIAKINKYDLNTKIVIISVKPSIARWSLRRKYKSLNKKLELLCKLSHNLTYVNIWDIMLENKKLRTNIFLSDGLHMNNEGYALWHSIIKDYID
ncbi:G-D-S-L family lipolytic protein [Cellulophaga baltica]|uniref:GDSL-type esterase/lipase family protein n=1 Tax=Cellulophaga TaxID=104264 RepID=UPI001C070A48|nr:GDSL-type esterase/lipase family protein [Cellulophaga sp. 1_MG-2023]MBU2997875.1 G-D-S-L family lipolytic protein [Cellulophaga baltica]MDO6769276.1 GDSL-type esterase/lipase family protein [Cellulophaga sp. 1_MG-2023]